MTGKTYSDDGWPSAEIDDVQRQLLAVVAPSLRCAETLYALFVGVDPGITGALGVLLFDPTGVPVVGGVIDLPTTPDPGDKVKGRQRIDVVELDRRLSWIGAWAGPRATLTVERFSPIPSRRGASMHADDPEKAAGWMRGMEASNTRLSGTCAAISAVVECAAARHHMRCLQQPTPQQWRKALGLSPSLGKDEARAAVQRQIPQLAHRVAAKAHHNRAEALLIALYGRRVSS